VKHCARILDQFKCAHFGFVVKQLRLWPKKLVFRSYRRTKRGCWPHVTSDSPNAGVVFVVRCPCVRSLSVVRCPCARVFEVPYIEVLQLRARIVLQAINIYCNSIKRLQTFYLKSLRDLFCAYPRISPSHN
jgi:hypothetical protein